MSQPPPPPGWYPDPWRRAPWRWWDGRAWTPHVSQPAPVQQPPWLAPGPAVAAEQVPARWLRVAVLVEAALFVPQLIGVGASWRTLARDIREDTTSTATGGLALLQIFGFITIGVAVLRLVWLMRAAEAGKRLGRPARREPGLAGAGWIIPIVSFWWPYQDVKALIGADHPERHRVGWWWALHLTGLLSTLAVIGTGFAPLGVQVVAVAIGALAFAAAALIERDLIAAVLAEHEGLLARGGS